MHSIDGIIDAMAAHYMYIDSGTFAALIWN